MEGTLGFSFIVSLCVISLIVMVYVIYGGLMGVMYTDAFLAAIMISAAVFLLVKVYTVLGGIVPAHQSLTDMSLTLFRTHWCRPAIRDGHQCLHPVLLFGGTSLVP